MFTGIIRELGVVESISRSGNICKLSLRSKNIDKSVKTGDSICVNGVCLTVTSKKGDLLNFDLMAETTRNSDLAALANGDRVNLEGAIKAGQTLDGHFVLGHIDCVGVVEYIRRSGDGLMLRVGFPEKFSNLIVEKASIAVDGVSLTVGLVNKNSFEIHIIPHTLKSTTLNMKDSGDTVNLEFDILGKYVAKGMGRVNRTPISEEFLRSKGF
ncbi:MAG: riboflavin synthase [Candidatus Omnitrophica bacterium]|nr:riboflavin synthase [Candidatus Omnitrophota bacterium]